MPPAHLSGRHTSIQGVKASNWRHTVGLVPLVWKLPRAIPPRSCHGCPLL